MLKGDSQMSHSFKIWKTAWNMREKYLGCHQSNLYGGLSNFGDLFESPFTYCRQINPFYVHSASMWLKLGTSNLFKPQTVIRISQSPANVYIVRLFWDFYMWQKWVTVDITYYWNRPKLIQKWLKMVTLIEIWTLDYRNDTIAPNNG
jgi:hypothetical protein